MRQVKPTEPASCFLSDCRKLHFAFTPNFLLHEPRRVAGLKFSRRLLTCFWDSLLFIYSNGISSGSAKPQPEDHQIVSLALQGLENSAKLANILGLQVKLLKHFLKNEFFKLKNKTFYRIAAVPFSRCWLRWRVVIRDWTAASYLQRGGSSRTG